VPSGPRPGSAARARRGGGDRALRLDPGPTGRSAAACSNLHRLANDAYLGRMASTRPSTSRPPVPRRKAWRGGPCLHGPPSRDELAGARAGRAGPADAGPVPQQSRVPGGGLLLQERIPKATALCIDHAGARSRVGSRTVCPNPSCGYSPTPTRRCRSPSALQWPLPRDGFGRRRWIQSMERLALTRCARTPPPMRSDLLFCRRSLDPSQLVELLQPTVRAGRQYEAVFSAGRAEFDGRTIGGDVHRDRHLARGRRRDTPHQADQQVRDRRSLLVTSYAEVVLAPGVTDELHGLSATSSCSWSGCRTTAPS